MGKTYETFSDVGFRAPVEIFNFMRKEFGGKIFVEFEKVRKLERFSLMVVVILDLFFLIFLTLLKAKAEMSFLTVPIFQHGSLSTSNFFLKFCKICELKSSEINFFQAMM